MTFVFAFSAFMPIASWVDCSRRECRAAAQAREEAQFQRNRDPDKRTLYYWPLHDAGALRMSWMVYMGDHLKLVSNEDGVETFVLEKWFAVEGPDFLLCRLTVKFRGDTKISHQKEVLVPERAGYC